MRSFLKRLPMNIFTLLLAAAGMAFAFRAVNLFTYAGQDPAAVGSIAEARAQRQVSEEPPPMTQADINRAAQTANAPSQTAQDNDPVAQATGDGPESIQLPQAPLDAAGNPPDTSTEAGQRAFTAPEIEVLQSLARRREALDKREQKLAAQEALLSAAEQEVDRKIAELNKLRAEIESLLGKQQEMEESQIASLVKIYENMKPKEAADIFNTLDLDILVTVISRMAERKSSPILASMNTEKARLVTIRLAEMRKLPGEKQPPAGR